MFATILALCSSGANFSSRPEPRAVVGEVVALFGTAPRALVDPPESITAVYSFQPNGTRVDYSPGSDYAMTPTGITRTPGSSIFDFSTYSVTLNDDGKFVWVDSPRHPPLVVNKHVYVDYLARKSTDIVQARAPSAPSGKLLIAGDSIAGGAHTVASVASGSLSDAYAGLLAAHLAGRMTVSKISEDGGSLTLLTAALPGILASDPPSAVVIAYGMNDHSAGPSGLAYFKGQLVSNISLIKGAGGRAILVGFPRKNPQWIDYSLSDIIAYNDAIEQAARETGSAFVDIESAFEEARKVKTTIELFGDNYHHPSNYGHRIYFSQILPHLLAVPVSAAQVNGYLRVP